MRYAVQDAAVVELPALERRLGAIAAIAQIAPLVGLLGTVLGMATTFRAFMDGGEYATAHALATGMWQALLTAGAALALAIPAHLAHHLLYGRVRSIVRDVEWAGNEIMRYLLIDYRDAPATTKRVATHTIGTATGASGEAAEAEAASGKMKGAAAPDVEEQKGATP